MSTNTIGYRPTNPRDWEVVNMTLQAENSDPNDIESLRDVRSRTIAYGHQMNFSSERYPSVRLGPMGTYEAGPSNVYTEPGHFNVYTSIGPSNVYTLAGPSNIYTEAGPSNAFTPEQPLNITPKERRHFGISPVPFEGSDLNTPVDERQVHPPRQNRRRPCCGTRGHI
ncbi:UNVERIFIED_CONTAM: hypothetical protein Sradi_5262200 [Sesamum radiatum]|uniref:Uncharacterized protein n=1 Tax=Sesamum radiatum TaxID=300843 RepID=A0AAW2LNL8_SESRA